MIRHLHRSRRVMGGLCLRRLSGQSSPEHFGSTHHELPGEQPATDYKGRSTNRLLLGRSTVVGEGTLRVDDWYHAVWLMTGVTDTIYSLTSTIKACRTSANVELGVSYTNTLRRSAWRQ